MKLAHFRLQNYKNLNLEKDLEKGINFIIADNGSGKTNFLEAINYLAATKSFRKVSDDAVFPRTVEDLDVLRAPEVKETVIAAKNSDNTELKLYWLLTADGKIAKQYYLNAKLTSPAKFKQQCFALVYSPDSLDLLLGGASQRRDFLDDFIAKLEPEIGQVQTEYQKVLAQKNKLLKSYLPENKQENHAELEFWNQKIAKLGAILSYERIQFLKQLEPALTKLCEQMEIIPGSSLSYYLESRYLVKEKQAQYSLIEIQSNLQRLLVDNLEKEIIVKHSMYGPHRDDLVFLLSAKNLREHASRGQQRLFSFALFAAAVEILAQKRSDRPILLLDDLLSELDDQHRLQILEYLLELIKQNPDQQIFITIPTKKLIPKQFQKSTKIIKQLNLS